MVDLITVLAELKNQRDMFVDGSNILCTRILFYDFDVTLKVAN